MEIDDFHWADADSAASLTELLRAPDPPPLLLIVSFRTEEIETKPFLRALVDQVRSGTHVVVPLSPLSGDEVAQLIDRLVSSGETLRQHRLREVETILEVSARVCVGRAAAKLQSDRIDELVARLRTATSS